MHKQFRVQRSVCCVSQALDINHYSKKRLFLLSNSSKIEKSIALQIKQWGKKKTKWISLA